MVQHEWRYEPERTAPRLARHQVSDVLAVGRDPDDNLGDCVRLIVSELATNAVLHARTPFSVRVACDDHVLRLEVRDGNGAMPERRVLTPDALSGRGLALVEIYSDRWGTERLADGKIVWCELDLPWKGPPDEVRVTPA